MAGKIGRPLEERFWEKVQKSDGCWLWTACTNAHGYGQIRDRKVGAVQGRAWLAHRLAWTLKHGPIPDDIDACHHCDNPPCCKTEPDEKYPNGHLFLGTAADNAADMVAKGRSNRGERNGNTLLTAVDVLRIRQMWAAGVHSDEIAMEHGIHPMSVPRVASGRRWKHLV